MALSDKHEFFCHEYLKDLNATQAYMRVYGNEISYHSAGNSSHLLMKNDEIRTRIKELQKERADALMLDATYVLENLVAVSQRCQQAEPVKAWDNDERCMKETGEYVFDSNGANKSLELLGKHLGMFKDKVEHSGEVATQTIIIQGQKFASDDNANNR